MINWLVNRVADAILDRIRAVPVPMADGQQLVPVQGVPHPVLPPPLPFDQQLDEVFKAITSDIPGASPESVVDRMVKAMIRRFPEMAVIDIAKAVTARVGAV